MREFRNYEPDSDEFYDEEGERVWTDDDPLVRRLRGMKWAEVPTDVRERCWDQIKQRIERLERQGMFPAAQATPEVNCERYGFSRRRAGTCRSGSPQGAIGGPAGGVRSRAVAFAGR
jgi:hypothetical protein